MSRPPRPARGGRFLSAENVAPLFTPRGLVVALLLALALCWPLVATGHLRAFDDSGSYLRGGDAIWRIAAEAVGLDAGSGSDARPADATAPAAEDRGDLGDTSQLYGRSITYAALFGGVVRTAGPTAFTFLQCFLVSLAILALIDRRALHRPVLLALGLGVVALASPAAWMSSYLMPDVLGAVVLIFAAILIDRFEAFTLGQKIALSLLAAFTVSSHYGNIPLAAAVVGAAMALRALSRRGMGAVRWKPVVLAGLFVVAAAPVLNVSASLAVLGEPSVTPLRPPVVLARSLEDGPARWLLEERCAENGADYCAAFETEVPRTHYDFLWGERGLVNQDGATAASLRENEWRIVREAALAYPLQQIAATLRNTWRQLLLVSNTGGSWTWDGETFERASAEEGFFGPARTDALMRWTVIVSGVVLVGLVATRRLDGPQLRILGLICFGLVVNAFIFGALSAPAERYQARVAWLLPLLAVLFIAETGFGRRPRSAEAR
jgi:hypothetical protein